MIRLVLITLLTIVLSGCAGSLEAARTEGAVGRRAVGAGERDMERCRELDSEYRSWSAWEQFSLSLAAGTGAGQFPVSELPERYQSGTRVGLAAGTIATAAFAAFAADRRTKLAELWASECSE